MNLSGAGVTDLNVEVSELFSTAARIEGLCTDGAEFVVKQHSSIADVLDRSAVGNSKSAASVLLDHWDQRMNAVLERLSETSARIAESAREYVAQDVSAANVSISAVEPVLNL